MTTVTAYVCANCLTHEVPFEHGLCVECLDPHDASTPHVRRESCTEICLIILRGMEVKDWTYLHLGWIDGVGYEWHQRYWKHPSFHGPVDDEDENFRHVVQSCTPECPLYTPGK